MVSLFDKASQAAKNSNKIMSMRHQEFLKRIKKTLYYGPSNPNRMISQPLAQHVASHFNETHRNYDLNILDLKTVSRIRQQTPCSLILSLIYLERLIKADPNYVRLVSPSELFLVTLMVSAKFYSDYDESDVFAANFAYEGEISLERLKQLEISFLNAIEWKIFVSQNEFYEKLKTVEKLLALKEGLVRNSFTYAEMNLLAPTMELAKLIFHYTTILMFTYVCSIMTIALSSIILTSIPLQLATTNENVTNSTALLRHVMIFDDETECAFEKTPASCNFTIDFALFNNFEWEMKKNYQDYAAFELGPIQKINQVRVVW
ncbi:hypothetical protein PVAND_013597 [Polypedilum vanderplanki]|uniref:Protein CNPPD1 n=1 Tax=Polypedilum vanderplanki TaxID=319348 RepID=A0A9J6CPW1_POLVA|nr:hypothetical protein PVAND_013597 [Polypedilum vanderplanki]